MGEFGSSLLHSSFRLCVCLLICIVPFLMGQNIQATVAEPEDLQAAVAHVSIAYRYFAACFAEYISNWAKQQMASCEHVAQLGVSFAHSQHGKISGRVLIVVFFVGGLIVTWRIGRPKGARGSTNIQHGGDDGMEILRTTRERASTFDFFGTHTTGAQNRERSGSIGDLSRSDRGDFRRERMGSMDLFYSQTDLLRKGENKRTKSANRPSRSRRKKTNSTGTLSSYGEIPHDAFLAQQALGDGGDDKHEGYLFDEFGLVTLSHQVLYYGPRHTALRYDTWTPPTSWAEASRRIVPQDIMLKLQRTLLLDMHNGTLAVKEPKSGGKWDICLPAQAFSVHVEPPVEGCVMSLYVKGASKEGWMEHTFESAQEAAQFQLDLLAHQVLGATLNNMFQVLSLVHSGSQAYDGQEFVLHDDMVDVPANADSEAKALRPPMCGVAWDDAMRALSSIPTIRIALERLWLRHRRPTPADYSVKKKRMSLLESKSIEDPDAGLLREEYTNKRLMLGPVDFFRLFVPALPETALPQSESNRSRMEQLLSWRKRAARAAVLIRAYTMSHRVVNIGWQLYTRFEGQPATLKRRLAFDDNEDNNRRDANSKNEIYEASVSRDVLCHVRPFDYFSQTAAHRARDHRLVLSPYQAYALVGAHVFKKPEIGASGFPLHPSRDPVDVIPSLQKLIADNSDLDFFVTCFHRDETVSVMCYVRSLAKGIDPQFDNVISRFLQSSEATRDRKLHMMIQMGQSQTLSFLGMFLLRFLLFLFSLTRKGRESPLSLQARRDRTPFPAIRIASYAQVFHFGGGIQKLSRLPQNYVAMSMVVNAKDMPNMIPRILFSKFESQMSERVLDFTMVIEGDQEDELPERALCSARMVRVDTEAVAKIATLHELRILEPSMHDNQDVEEQTGFSTWARKSATQAADLLRSPFVNVGLGSNSASRVINGTLSPTRGSGITNRDSKLEDAVESVDPIESATNEVTVLLRNVEIPVRRASLVGHEMYTVVSVDVLPEGVVLVPVLKVLSRDDIKRFVFSTGFDIKKACVRIVETYAWRGRTFPVDTLQCRIELQSGQFFQQGVDRQGNPVFYFSTMCRGPWRRNVEATLSAAIHRFDVRLKELRKSNPDTCCTLVVLLGRAREGKHKTKEYNKEGTNQSHGDTSDDKNDSASDSHDSNDVLDSLLTETDHRISNPRMSNEEHWQLHTNREVIEQLVFLLLTHYPGRVSRILFAKGKGPKVLYKTNVVLQRAIKGALESSEIRGKVRFLLSLSRLQTYIQDDELCEIAEGSAPLSLSAFECFLAP